MEIAKCRLCGANSTLLRLRSNKFFVETNCEHNISGPIMDSENQAIELFNEMKD